MRLSITVGMLVLLASFSTVGAQEGEADLESSPSSFDIGLEIYDFSYEEPGLMEMNGEMLGLTGTYTYSLQQKPLAFRGNARIAFGQVDYDGQTQGGDPVTASGIDDLALELRGVMLFENLLESEAGFAVSPYCGIGYRYLFDQSSSFPGGYDRESNYLYSPIGVELSSQLSANWALMVTGEYDFFWGGVQKSALGDVGFSDVENEQKDGYGARFAVGVEKVWAKRSLALELFYRHWDIDASEIEWTSGWAGEGAVFEPENETDEIGLLLALTF